MTISGISGKLYIWRCLVHIPIGLVTAWMIKLSDFPSVIIGILFYLGFIKYELNEDFCINDFAYPDIAGSLWGIFIYMVYWVLRYGA